MMIIPQQASKRYSEPNTGDFFGNIKQTKNISFVKNGYISLEKRTRSLFDSQTYTDLINATGQSIVKFAQVGNKIWVAGTKSLYYLNSTLTTLTKDATASTPTLSTDYTDIVGFKNDTTTVLAVANSSAGSLKYYDGAWKSVTVDVIPQVLCVFENQRALAVAGNNLVQLVDGTMTKSTLLTLPGNFVVKSMAWNNNRLYIATLDSNGGDAFIFEWDGVGTEANYGHIVKGGLVSAIARYQQNGVVFVTNNGQLMKLEGVISELANFPIYYSNKQWFSESNFSTYANPVLHGGIVVDRDMIFIALSPSYSAPYPDTTADYYENDFYGGIWCYDPEVGLYNRYSVGGSLRTVTGAITTANVNTSTDVITIPSAIVPDTGTQVFYDDGSAGGGTLISPLKWNTTYYVIKVSSTTLKLATSKANSLAGTAIDLTSTGNNSQTLIFCPNDDFGGSFQIAKSLFLLRSNSSISLPEKSRADKLIIGSLVTKSTGGLTQYASINSVEWYQENRGFFTTPRLLSPNATDTFKKLFCKYRPLKNEYDKIIFKYRKLKKDLKYNKLYLPSTTSNVGTIVTSTTFTVTDITDMEVGYEIEIISSAGAGYFAHITNISAPVAGVYTITIDEAIQNISAGNTFQFTVDNWIKIPTILSTSYPYNKDGFAEIALPEAGRATAIELKVELRGEDVAIEELQVINSVQQPAI